MQPEANISMTHHENCVLYWWSKLLLNVLLAFTKKCTTHDKSSVIPCYGHLQSSSLTEAFVNAWKTRIRKLQVTELSHNKTKTLRHPSSSQELVILIGSITVSIPRC